MEKLTARQKQILVFIQKHLNRSLPFPSLREIGDAMAINNKSGVAGHLNALEKKGYIKRRAQRVSDFELIGESDDSFPLLGTIPAGIPIQTFPQDDVVQFDHGFFGNGKLFALRICGDSMSGDAICDGDIAIIQAQEQAHGHEITAVRINGDEVTLKRLKFRDHLVDLIPSNPDFPKRTVDASGIELVGVLVGIVRRRTK